MNGGELINLLCIIHRDGGHYIQKHGMDKAYADAVDILHRWKTLPDEQPAQKPRPEKLPFKCKECGHIQEVPVIYGDDGRRYFGSGADWCDNCHDGKPELLDPDAEAVKAERAACQYAAVKVAAMVPPDGTQWERGWFEAATRISEDIGERK